MKRILVFFISLLLISTILILLFIPSSITISGYETVNIPTGSINRLFERKDSLKKWWPGSIINDTVFVYQNTRYTILRTTSFVDELNAERNGLDLYGEISTVSFRKDTSTIQFKYQPFHAGFNPIERVIKYLNAIALKKQLTGILDSLKQFSENVKNIYGFDVVEDKVKDSSYIFTTTILDHYPSTKEVGDLIGKLRQHIIKYGGIETGVPMLHVDTTNIKYQVMTAIPLLKDIPQKGDILIKKMILGNILVAKITGGPFTIMQGEKSLEDFTHDFGKTSPALPFQSIETDREKEPDTSKWITYLKYPVF